MNKTVNVNLGGLVFHIDENAYDVLKRYIQSLKQHFSTSDGGEEIIADIEARIGEMFQKRMNESREVIELADVEEVINKMGKPEEFAETTEQQKRSAFSQEEYTGASTKKRLFRHPDDKILGGVCGGISAYFDIDPIWMRLAFAGAFFIMGWGFLLYLILWIVVPKARTTAEKLQMRGEAINVENIERTIREEMGEVKERVKGFAQEARQAGKDGRIRTTTQRVVDCCVELLEGTGRVIGKIFGVLFLCIGIVLLCFLFGMLTGSYHLFSNGLILNGKLFSIKDALFNDGGQYTLTAIAIGLLVGIPLLMLVYKAARMVFGVKIRSQYINITAMSLWLIGLLVAGYVFIDTHANFRKRYSYKHSVPIIQPKGNTLYIEVNDTTLVNNNFTLHLNRGFYINDEDDGSFGGLLNTKFNVVKSLTDSFQMIQEQSARGRSQSDAMKYAEAINYSYSQNDSTLLLNAIYTWGKENKFRMQRVKLILKVPVGKAVYLGRNTETIIDDIKNTTNTYDGNMPGHKWLMTARGLTCVDCEEWETQGKHHKSRHHNSDNDDESDD